MFRRLKNKFFKKKIEQPSILNSFPGGVREIDDTEDNDVFIVGFPKSGNTLIQHIIAHLIYGVNSEVSRSMVNLIVPDIYANKHYFRFNDVCYFKSHNLPDPRYKKVIYIVRDGRSALLSYYHMLKDMGQEVSLEELYKGELKIFGVEWHEHIEEWEQNPYNADILFIKYEDLVKDKIRVLLEICQFINIKRTEEELKEVSKLSSLEFMKKLEQKSDWKKMKKANNFIENRNFVNTGKTVGNLDNVDKKLLIQFNLKALSQLEKYFYI